MKEYKKKIEFKEIQSLEYNLLKRFDEFAKENNIMYFLSGGSCLGAVRHQDFIPWDDDIDVCMLRKDYDKLIALVKDNRYRDTERKYKFLLPLDDNYIYPCFEFRQIKNARFKIDGNFKQALAKMIEYINLYKNNIISKCDNCLNYSICQDCVINFIKNEFNCDIYTELRNNILDYKKETKLNMKNKYDTKELECERLVLKKGTSEDCIKVYEYDMLKKVVYRGIVE